MPEGPEIRRAADRVARVVSEKIADEVFFAFDHLKPFETQLTDRRVLEVTTRGKAMLTRFEGGLSVYTHNQLYGKWYVMPAERLPKTNRKLRFAVRAGGRRALLYSASDIEVLDAEEEAAHPFLSKLGPDLLSQTPSVDELAARLDARAFRRRQLGALLLDQSFVAGLGNYLRAEVMFEANVHPRLHAADLDLNRREHLADRIIGLTRRAYRTRGVTLPDERAEELKAQGVKRSKYRFWVYGRADQPCRLCRTPLLVENIGGRKCFWCPGCQPADEKSL